MSSNESALESFEWKFIRKKIMKFSFAERMLIICHCRQYLQRKRLIIKIDFHLNP